MNFQILNIAVYGINGKIRTIELFPNAVNIITGQSKTGKSALLHIVDYCLGRRECNVPAGVIRKHVSWYALKLQLSSEEVIIARRNPDLDKESSEDIYIEKGVKVDFPPDLESIHKTANLDALNVLLGEILKIDDFSFEPPPGQTRKPGTADVSKSLFFCLQEQTEIANNKFLFHRQGEPYIPQAIKDFLPFFLGVITRDDIRKRESIRNLKRQLEMLNARISENERLQESGFKQAYALINEAKSVGLIEYSEDLPASWDAIHRVISNALDQDFENVTNLPDEKLLDEMLEMQQEIRGQYRKAEAELQSLVELKRSSRGFGTELNEQKSRLESIGHLWKYDKLRQKARLTVR